MRIFQCTAEADEALHFPKLGFGEDAEMHHAVGNECAVGNFKAIHANADSILGVNGIKAVEQRHKSVAERLLILGGYANAVGGDVDGISRGAERKRRGTANSEGQILAGRGDEGGGLEGEILPKFRMDRIAEAGVCRGGHAFIECIALLCELD